MNCASRWGSRFAFLSLAGLGMQTLSAGQANDPASDFNYRETFAIVGGRVEIGDGRSIPKGTVLVRDGRIEAVGASVSVPAYAKVIKADGMVVYPAFIDAFHTKSVKMPEAASALDAKVDAGVTTPSSMRKANRKGTRPELDAINHLDLSAQMLLEERKAGFGQLLAAPTGGMINGTSALVMLSGRAMMESVLSRKVGMDFGFQSGGTNEYPAVLLGVMAHLRQVLMDAEAAKQAGGPSVTAEWLAPLEPVLEGRMPAMFEADRSHEIVRALGLARQFQLRPIIVGGQEAFKQARELKAHRVPIILSLNYDREPSPAKKPASAKQAPAPPKGQAPLKTDDPIDIPEGVITERQTRWVERVRTAKTLADEGIQFAFTSKGAKNRTEFWKAVRRAIAEGLPKEAALRALTKDAASILGVDRELGTLEVGKRASIVVMSSDFSKDDSVAKFMLLDNWLFKPDSEKPPAQVPPVNFEDEEEEIR